MGNCPVCMKYSASIMNLSGSRRDWNTDAFSRTLKQELENLGSGVLPVEQATSQGGYVDDSDITATVLGVAEEDAAIVARVGIFFTEIVINCGCGDDPMPVNAYCEMRIAIDKTDATATASVIES